MFRDDDNKIDESVEKLLLLTSELLKIDKIIEMMKKHIDKKT